MRFLVIGETCNDQFIYGKVERICPEAPVPVFRPTRKTNHLGMAANVYYNLKAIARSVSDGEFRVDLLSNFCKGSKTRYVDENSNQMLLRIDDESYSNFQEITDIKYNQYDAIIISDYDKGFLSHDDINRIAFDSNQNSDAWLFLDTKKKIRSAYDFGGFDFIKINEKEFNENGFKEFSEDMFDQLIVTKGSKGCTYNKKHYPCQATQVFDVSGAGDTFLAAFAYQYTTTENVEKSIDFAQKCCSIVVSKKGVCTI